ncbi:pentatricopeptide repeat-containing protein At1g71210, mitochondrial [Salvia miltiorrhiza]|uniref:pentatricopeptide repeat-containing protein At1g71210, mitochondrial n=1 Tax=Salvia miltiorrhiza TaxID=226208 RepID=UPI0025ABF80D|nr:pentatricopeptide repeat-containing protein At1g71210, mitochondrial [Salvia miltiorrhiza]
MLTLRYARQSRSLIHPAPASATTTAALSSVAADLPVHLPSLSPSSSTYRSVAKTQQSDLAYYFREWFMSRKIPLYDSILEALRAQEGAAADADLSRFNLRLTEELVLDVLRYNKKDVLTSLKFFDWAGRQPNFFHTRATFCSIFRIISKAKLTSLMLDFLQDYGKHADNSKKLYHNILVIGYSLAGQCETALIVFGKMRFLGHDLDRMAYNVLLNALVDNGHYDFVESLAREARTRGCEDSSMHAVMLKSYCKQNQLERAEEYLRDLMKADDGKKLNRYAMSTFISALCKNNQFERAFVLIEEFKSMGVDMKGHLYSSWMSELVKVGKTDDALEFFKDKKVVDDYLPDVFHFNMLICRLLKENRLEEVYDLLVEMTNRGVVPNDVTMNAVLCFLCKAGLLDVAMGLYNSKAEFGLSVNRMAYNYLLNTLLGEASVMESYNVLQNSLKQGYFPGARTLSIVTDALCREGKFSKMKELVMFLLENKIVPRNFEYDKFISAFCRASRVEEAYMLHDLLTGLDKSSRKFAYCSMIDGFTRSDRGDIAVRLLIEMQESNYRPNKKLYRGVICCLLKMDNPETRFFGLLEMQLHRGVFSRIDIYTIFIDGAGHAGRPDLAVQLLEMMQTDGLRLNLNASILLLQSYLKNRKVPEALLLFCDLSLKWRSRKLWNAMIVGLCRVRELDYALKVLENMHGAMVTPSLQCYEELIKLYCDLGQYDDAIDLLDDMTKIGRQISSFIGNVFLLHSLRSRSLYDAWVFSSENKKLTSASWMLGHLIGIFSGSIEGIYLDEDIETLIQQCFQIDLYTYNMMLRRLIAKTRESASNLVHRLRKKGYKPNRWTYDIIIHGLARQGRDAEARKWLDEMLLQGFSPNWLPRRRIE